ncbi:PH domain-containing protein [Stackebrandtia nassauensis]|uniref:PH domain-containing protein n=1 Tax=Stackebrandtia nassauensis TaxID=283811 RepID=UPI0001A393F0|nr:PH domain-containing protein [Stackebrandtia nassauensis]
MTESALRWRVPRHVVAVKVASTAVFALSALWFSGDVARFSVAVGATLLAGAYAVRDLVAPIRLTADAEGVGVSRGFFGLRYVAWSEIARIRVDERRRFGATTKLLEIDVDYTLFLFSRHELGAEPDEVADALRELRDRVALPRRAAPLGWEDADGDLAGRRGRPEYSATARGGGDSRVVPSRAGDRAPADAGSPRGVRLAIGALAGDGGSGHRVSGPGRPGTVHFAQSGSR